MASSSSLQHQFLTLANWFRQYVEQFPRPTKNHDILYRLKFKHSMRVQKLMAQLGEALNLSDEVCILSQIVGLLHDVGRFPQYKKFETFQDKDSCDHGDMGENSLKHAHILTEVIPKYQNLIITTVKLHNKFQISPNLPRLTLNLTRMLRDCDKLDILMSIAEISSKTHPIIRKEFYMGISNEGPLNPQLVDQFLNHHRVNFSKVQSIADLKIAILSWIYDFNFKQSFSLLKSMNILNRIVNQLPQEKQKAQIRHQIQLTINSNT